MPLDDHIDQMSSFYGNSILDFQGYMVNEVMDLYSRGYTGIQISNVLQTIDMEEYILNTFGGQTNINQLSGMYEELLSNLEGFGPITPETLTALTNMNQATFTSNMINTANQTRQALATGVIMDNSEEQLRNMLLNGQGGLTFAQATTLANTSLNTYSRSVTRVMAEEMPDNTKYYYDGPIDDRTRQICIEISANGTLTMREIDERFPGAFVDGGGWNCRHRWTMSTRSDQGEKSSAVKRRDELIEKGNYNPQTLLEQYENE